MKIVLGLPQTWIAGFESRCSPIRASQPRQILYHFHYFYNTGPNLALIYLVNDRKPEYSRFWTGRSRPVSKAPNGLASQEHFVDLGDAKVGLSFQRFLVFERQDFRYLLYITF